MRNLADILPKYTEHRHATYVAFKPDSAPDRILAWLNFQIVDGLRDITQRRRGTILEFKVSELGYYRSINEFIELCDCFLDPDDGEQ
jgi:hypothetical protein